MAEIKLLDLRKTRLEKVDALRELGINPYPSQSSRTHFATPIVDNFEAHEGQQVRVAGRLMSFRKQGALAFGHIQDQTGRIQLFLRRDTLQETTPSNGILGFADLKLVDVGDFVEATGTVMKTQRGEISVRGETLRILTKSIRPLPDKWGGLKDRETILRKRYLDTTVQPDHKRPFKAVSKMVFAIRTFLDERGFLEFNTPVIQPQYGGGTAKPFLTHVNALHCRMYLAISHELYLKRLIAAGFDKVYTIGRYFRNEGIDRSHHPEFSMVETMTAYENYEYNMALIEDMFRYVANSAFGKSEFTVAGHQIDFARPWRRVSMTDAIKEVTTVDFASCTTVDEANSQLRALGIHEDQENIGLAIVKAFEERVEETLISPTLVFGHPVEISPLAKPMDSDPRFAERFEIFIAGMECGDNWSEQNDPIRLLERWKANYDQEEGSHPLDFDFVEVLEHGMPPTTGIGPGIERMAMIFTEQDNIDEVIFFPMMRPVLSDSNRAAFGLEPKGAEAPPEAESPHALGSDEADVVLTMDEFDDLIADGILCPQGRQITVRPFLRIWKAPAKNGLWLASGYLEVDGFLEGKQLRLPGCRARSEERISFAHEAKALVDIVHEGIQETLKRMFPKVEIEVLEVAEVADSYSAS